jgi:hypothetical protein
VAKILSFFTFWIYWTEFKNIRIKNIQIYIVVQSYKLNLCAKFHSSPGEECLNLQCNCPILLAMNLVCDIVFFHFWNLHLIFIWMSLNKQFHCFSTEKRVQRTATIIRSSFVLLPLTYPLFGGTYDNLTYLLLTLRNTQFSTIIAVLLFPRQVLLFYMKFNKGKIILLQIV